MRREALKVTKKERYEQLLNSRLNEVYKSLDRLYGTLMTIPKGIRPHYLKKAYTTLSSFHSHAAIALISSYGDSNQGDVQKSHGTSVVEAGSALPLDGGVKCQKQDKRKDVK